MLHLYFARDLSQGECHPDDDEFIAPERVPLDELVDQAMSGALKDGKTIALILMVRRLLDQENG